MTKLDFHRRPTALFDLGPGIRRGERLNQTQQGFRHPLSP